MRKAVVVLILLGASLPCFGAVTGANGYVTFTYFAAPDPSNSPLVSFDWGQLGSFYYTTGDGNWQSNFNVYQVTGSVTSNIYSTTEAFAGSRLTAIGPYLYFNDGGSLSRWTYDYFRYDPAMGGAPVNMTNGVGDMWGIATQNQADFFASGGWSASIYYSPVDGNGDWTLDPPLSLGAVGESSGPIAFDGAGNMYYSQGYVGSGQPALFFFSAAEVAAAIADPVNAPLTPDGNVLCDIEGNFTGATGMTVDADENIILSATNYGMPSEVRQYVSNPAGELLGYQVVANSPLRVDTLRFAGNRLYCNDADGVYGMSLAPTVLYCRPLAGAAANENPVAFEVAFSGVVSGLDPQFADFQIEVISSKGAKAAPEFVANSLRSTDNQVYTFGVNVTDFLGEIAVNVLDSGAIVNLRGEALAAAYVSPSIHVVDTVVPEIDYITVSQERATRGETVTIEVYVSEDLAQAPEVTVNGNLAVYLPEKTPVYRYSYEVGPGDIEGPARIAVSGLDMAGNPTGVYAVTDLLWLDVPKLPLQAWPLGVVMLGLGALILRRKQ